MNREVTILAAAADGLEAGRDFYEACEPGAGGYFIDCLISDIASLRFFAGIHRE